MKGMLMEGMRRGWRTFWEPFAWVWREAPHICGFMLGVSIAAIVLFVMLMLMLRKILEGTI